MDAPDPRRAVGLPVHRSRGRHGRVWFRLLAVLAVTDGHRFRRALHGRTDVPAGVLVVGGCHPHECADATGRPAAGR